MARLFNAFSSAAVLGVAFSANALMLSPSAFQVSENGKNSRLTLSSEKSQIQLSGSRVGEIFKMAAADGQLASAKIYSTTKADYAVVEISSGGEQGLYLLKHTKEGLQAMPIKASGLSRVEDVDAKIIQPMVVQQGLDATMEQLETVLNAVSGQESQANEARLILVDGNYERPAYPYRRPLPPPPPEEREREHEDEPEYDCQYQQDQGENCHQGHYPDYLPEPQFVPVPIPVPVYPRPPVMMPMPLPRPLPPPMFLPMPPHHYPHMAPRPQPRHPGHHPHHQWRHPHYRR